MIKGLDHFRNYFAGNSEDFVVIGGVAAHEIMGNAGLDFRATKDIDLVIIARPATVFCQKLVAYIETGQYRMRHSKEGRPTYYRFLKPTQPEYPAQIEIFSRRPDDLTLENGQHIVPIAETPPGADLSAILLEDDYFDLIKNSIQSIQGLPIASTEAVIAIKSRAFNDMTDRKALGDASVSNDEIKKHRNDILRLSQALTQTGKIKLTGLPRTHMTKFLDDFAAIDILEAKQLFKQFGISDTLQVWILVMRRRFLM